LVAEKYRILAGIKAYSSSGHGLLKRIFKEVGANAEVLKISSIYKVRGRMESTHRIHDLRSFDSFEGLSVVAQMQTELSPSQLLKFFEGIEINLKSEILHRSVSLNLLVYEDRTLMTPQLTLPHPEFHRRPEELFPAAEVWGDYTHPVLKKNIYALTKEFTEESEMEFYAQGKTLLDF